METVADWSGPVCGLVAIAALYWVLGKVQALQRDVEQRMAVNESLAGRCKELWEKANAQPTSRSSRWGF